MTEKLLPVIIFITIHAKSSYSFPDRDAGRVLGGRGFDEGLLSGAFNRLKTFSSRAIDENNHYITLASKMYYNPTIRKFTILDGKNNLNSIPSVSQGRSSKTSGFWNSFVDFFSGGFFNELRWGEGRRAVKRKKKILNRFDYDSDSEEDFDPLGSFLDGLGDMFVGTKRKRINHRIADRPIKLITPPPPVYDSEPAYSFDYQIVEDAPPNISQEQLENVDYDESETSDKYSEIDLSLSIESKADVNTSSEDIIVEKSIESPVTITKKNKIEEKSAESPETTTRKYKIIEKSTESPVKTTRKNKIIEKSTESPVTTTKKYKIKEKSTESPVTTTGKNNNEPTSSTTYKPKVIHQLYSRKTTRKPTISNRLKVRPVKPKPQLNRRPISVTKQTVYVKECDVKNPPSWISQMLMNRPVTEVPPTTKTPYGWFNFFSDDDSEPEEHTQESSGGWFNSIFGSETTTAYPQALTLPTTVPAAAAPPEAGWFDAIVNAEEDDSAYTNNTNAIKERKGRRRSYKGFQLLRINPDAVWKVKDLKEMQEDTQGSGLMWWSSPALNRSADLLVPQGLLSDVKDHLNSQGLHYDVVIWDLQKAITFENPRLSKTQRLELEKIRGHPMTWRRYHRYADILRYMEYLSLKYPHLIDLVPLGRSSEGMPIVAAKVSAPLNKTRNTNMDKKKWKLKSKMKPAIWIDGGMHAREWISPAVATWFLHALVQGEDGNGADMELLRIADWYILPVGNPDGYEHSHTTDRLWRKTRSKHSDDNNYFNSWFPWNWGITDCVGVDANRNWDYHWGEKGSSNDPCSDNYAGPKPFSEPETKAVSRFIMDNQEQIKVFITLHSYAQMWVMPTTHSREQFTDKADLLEMGKLAVNALSEVSGTKYQVGSMSDLLQPMTGTAHDWAKGRAGIKYSYAVKMRDSYGPYGFLLPGSQIIPTARETFEAVKAIADNL